MICKIKTTYTAEHSNIIKTHNSSMNMATWTSTWTCVYPDACANATQTHLSVKYQAHRILYVKLGSRRAREIITLILLVATVASHTTPATTSHVSGKLRCEAVHLNHAWPSANGIACNRGPQLTTCCQGHCKLALDSHLLFRRLTFFKLLLHLSCFIW